jgi:hypothetical protein
VSTTEFTEIVPDASAGFDIPVELCMLDRGNTVVAARIRRVSPARFELSCSEQLEKGQRLALSHEGRRIEVAVSFTEHDVPGVYLLAVKGADAAGEVRSELRLPTDLPAVVRVAGSAEQMNARVVDMSPSGMGMELATPMPLGSKVCVNIEQGLAFGEIRFCRQRPDGVYFVGFLLEEYIGGEGTAK